MSKAKQPKPNAAKAEINAASDAEPVAASNGATQAGASASPTPAQVCLSLGAVNWLMMQSPVHRHLFVSDLEWLILPPMMLGQTRLYHSDDKPLAFVAWAMLSEEVEARLMAGVARLRPDEWRSGDRPWIIETVAPFAQSGGLEKIVADLTETVFGGKRPRIVGEK